ncbi:tail fiber domain-containing protein [Citrobacter koseri]|uniref:tail fiber domain-containing protein n=1 Tax=Citrobacter koseri TaxID=545 RepID=UPI0019082C61|nr:tail fiber domain-containing protein [Citrobacter koseri]MBJ8810952.1 tail fiber domain-containing protein [Citrobacter koseri]
MGKLNIDANVLNFKAGDSISDPIHGGENVDNASLQLDVEQALMAIRRLESRTKIMQFSSVEDLGLLPETVTLDDLYKRVQVNSVMMIAVFRNSYPNLETPRDVAGNTQSGTLLIDGNSSAYARMGFTFYNEYGIWRRYYNTAYASGHSLRDSGWLWGGGPGEFLPIDAAGATNLNNLLSNLLRPGKYFVSGAVFSTLTDNPYGGTAPAAYITVERYSVFGNFIQTVKAASTVPGGYRRYITSAGVVSPWIQEFVSGTTLSTTGTIDFAGGTVSGHLSPNTAASKNLGGASLPFNNIYVQNAPVVVSDKNYKTDISAISDKVLDAWATVEYSQWKLKAAVAEKGEESARFHVGIIAQEIKEKFELAGLDATQYGILIHEKWDAAEASPASYDENGNLVSEEVLAKDAGEIWMVRMEECLALEAALMRRRTIELEERLTKLI